jgi:DNA-binding PadR family transcriptional regulator
MRVTVAVAVVLRVFLSDPAEQRYGYDLMKQTALGSSKLYPILDRLERAGWLCRDPEIVDPAVAGRPPRVFYRLTGTGQRAARLELAALSDQLRVPVRRAGKLAPGMSAG